LQSKKNNTIMKKSLLFLLITLSALVSPACQNKHNGTHTPDTASPDIASLDTAYSKYAVPKELAREPIVIDIEKLTPPQKLLDTISYDLLLQTYYFTGDTERVISHNRLDRQLALGGQNPFFKAVCHAYADHRPFELSPEALWLLICQGFSYHVNNNAEELRPLFVDFEGKKKLSVFTNNLLPAAPEDWERLFPQFTRQIASYVGGNVVSALGSDFTTSTPVSHTASQITVMVAMQKYFDYEITFICGIPRIILHGTPEDWQSIIDRLQVLRQYKLDWWVDAMLPVLEKIKRAAEGEVDKEFWRNMVKLHYPEDYGESCGPSHPDVDGWIVKFYPYDGKGKRNDLKILYEAEQHLPSEVLSVPVKVSGVIEADLLLHAGFVGIAQDRTTMALRPEIGWYITEQK
jgi:hypothetical protein